MILIKNSIYYRMIQVIKPKISFCLRLRAKNLSSIWGLKIIRKRQKLK